ncbi:MAG: GAF domain-containing protein [bacterium]
MKNQVIKPSCRSVHALRNMTAELERGGEERTLALRENTEQLQMTLEAANAVVWDLDLASGMLREHGPVTKFVDLPNGFRHGHQLDFFERVHPDDRVYVRRQIERAVQSDSRDNTTEFRVLRSDGEIRWMTSSGFIERDAAGLPLRLRGISLDITPRKQIELALARAHNALKVLADCNRVGGRATSELALLNEVCRIAVEVGGFRMAWIGYAEHDARKSVRPVALFGLGKDALSAKTLTWADTKYGCGPTGIAIRTGQLCVCRDVAKNLPSTPWQKEALKNDCASVLALPLLTEHGCLGMLMVCAEQSDAFDDTECQLLQQLAHDVVSAVMALRGRAERAELERQVLNISEREQRRFGQDLHDSVGQSIVGIGYLVQAVQQDLHKKSIPESAALERVSRQVAETVKEVRNLVRGLFPGELLNGRMTDALQGLARRTQDVFGKTCQFTGRSDVRMADDDMARQLYRIAQEAVNNAVKHSKADTIEIGLSRQRKRIVLTVRDSGVGLPEAGGNGLGMGLRIMKYRAGMIGATLKIESVRGQGTTITCQLPPADPTSRNKRPRE